MIGIGGGVGQYMGQISKALGANTVIGIDITDEKLEEIFVNEKYGTYKRNIEGMIEHCYYHLGQISLIKKMIIERK